MDTVVLPDRRFFYTLDTVVLADREALDTVVLPHLETFGALGQRLIVKGHQYLGHQPCATPFA